MKRVRIRRAKTPKAIGVLVQGLQLHLQRIVFKFAIGKTVAMVGNDVTFSWKNSISLLLDRISNITDRIGGTSAG